jgi:hypothetical protein
MEHNNELYHWGVKGMKWGVRRYQNPDGSLTNAGKKRQARIERKDQKKLQKKQTAWERKVKNNWVDAYNSAADKINKRMDAFNDKWGDKANVNNKAYTKAYCDMWNDIYVKELETSFGKSPIDTGRKWCETVPMFMNPEDY